MKDVQLQVVVGVIFQDNKLLITQRAQRGQHGGLWEFPGGKIESGETEFAALQREFNEELAIEITVADPFLVHSYEYPKRPIQLNVWWVLDYNGTVIGNEGQQIRWVSLNQRQQFKFPPANEFIFQAIQHKVGSVFSAS